MARAVAELEGYYLTRRTNGIKESSNPRRANRIPPRGFLWFWAE